MTRLSTRLTLPGVLGRILLFLFWAFFQVSLSRSVDGFRGMPDYLDPTDLGRLTSCVNCFERLLPARLPAAVAWLYSWLGWRPVWGFSRSGNWGGTALLNSQVAGKNSFCQVPDLNPYWNSRSRDFFGRVFWMRLQALGHSTGRQSRVYSITRYNTRLPNQAQMAVASIWQSTRRRLPACATCCVNS